MKIFWKEITGFPMCVDHMEGVYMQGNRDSVYNLKDSAYIIYEIHKCSNETKLPGYPDCKSDDEIEAWLENKYVMFKFINQKIDFTDRGEYAVRLNEVWFPSIPLKSGLYTDSGYRYRYNKFERYDHWWSKQKITDLFYDMKFFSSDTFTVPKTQKVLAEMYFRMEVDIISHQRVVFSSMDFIGSLGGVSGFVLQMTQFVIGGYAAFHSSVVTASAINKLKVANGE